MLIQKIKGKCLFYYYFWMLFDSNFLIINILFNHFLIVITFIPFLAFLFHSSPQKRYFFATLIWLALSRIGVCFFTERNNKPVGSTRIESYNSHNCVLAGYPGQEYITCELLKQKQASSQSITNCNDCIFQKFVLGIQELTVLNGIL